MNLTDRVAVVTGAGGGIGRATAEELARRGATVAVHYRRQKDGAEAAVCAIRRAGGPAEAFRGDLTVASDLQALFADVIHRFGRVDILVNNAGDLVKRAGLLDMSESLFREILDVNLTTTLLCSQAAARDMQPRKSGAIVNMASLAAHNGGGPGAFAYAAAKAAIIAMTKGMAKELAPYGIRVNCVSPGLIGETDFHGRFTAPEAFAMAEKTVPLSRAGTPVEVARVIAFLATDDAAYLVGETIEINGGMFMR